MDGSDDAVNGHECIWVRMMHSEMFVVGLISSDILVYKANLLSDRIVSNFSKTAHEWNRVSTTSNRIVHCAGNRLIVTSIQ